MTLYSINNNNECTETTPVFSMQFLEKNFLSKNERISLIAMGIFGILSMAVGFGTLGFIAKTHTEAVSVIGKTLLAQIYIAIGYDVTVMARNIKNAKAD